MPLSEHEENVLAEIERQLAAEDPRFAARARRRTRQVTPGLRRRLTVICTVLGVVGLSMLGVLSAPWNLVSASVGMLLLLLAIVLAVSAASSDDRRHRAVVPPDERT